MTLFQLLDALDSIQPNSVRMYELSDEVLAALNEHLAGPYHVYRAKARTSVGLKHLIDCVREEIDHRRKTSIHALRP